MYDMHIKDVIMMQSILTVNIICTIYYNDIVIIVMHNYNNILIIN